MAIALANNDVTNSIPRKVSGTDQTSYTCDTGGPSNNGTFTPGANSLLVAIIYTGADLSDPTSVTGNGATFTNVQETPNSPQDLFVFAADSGASPTSAAAVATWAASRDGCHLYILEFTGVDLTAGVAAAFVQFVGGGFSALTTTTVTLASAGDATNRSVSCFGHAVNEATTGDADAGTWVTIHDQGRNTPARALMVQWRSDAFDTDHDASWTTSSNGIRLGFELKATGGGGGGTTVVDPFGMSGFFGA